MIDFDGQVIVVTGAGRGLGQAYADLLASRAALVAVHDGGVNQDGTGGDPGLAKAVQEAIRTAGGQASAHTQDLATRAGCEELIAEVTDQHGRIDALIHNAGIVRYHGIADTTVEEWQRTAAINIDAAWWLCRTVWPFMLTQTYGRIVLTTSGYGLRVVPEADVAAYGVSKAAQFGLMNALAGEGMAHGVLVNAIAPIAATRIFRRPVEDGELTPRSVAPGVAMLASQQCPFTGRVLTAAGGRWGIQHNDAPEQHDLGIDATPDDLLTWATTRLRES